MRGRFARCAAQAISGLTQATWEFIGQQRGAYGLNRSDMKTLSTLILSIGIACLSLSLPVEGGIAAANRSRQ